MNIKKHREEMRNGGLFPYYNRIDFEVVRDTGPCECGSKLQYEGWKNKDEYHALSICQWCDTVEEF